jgi:tetratricopeptide (TPR) repeat protein
VARRGATRAEYTLCQHQEGLISRMRHKLEIMLTLAVVSGCAGSQLAAATPSQAEPTLSTAQLIDVAQELERRGESLRAEQYWNEALERGAEPDKVLPHLLSAYVRDRQYRLAAQRAEDHLRRHPSSTRVRLLLAALYQAVDDYAQAVRQYRAVVRLEPTRANAHYALATALVEEGQDRLSADEHFRRYLELAPNGPYAERAQAALLKEVMP